MYWFSYRRLLILMCILVVALVAISQGGRWAVANALGWPTASDPVTAAWTKARAAGSYHFTANVTQVTVPVANVTNVGRTSRTEQLHLEGQTDLRAKRLEMQLWSDGGSVLQNAGRIAFKSENGKPFTRRGSGEWQAADGFADTLAPQGDFLAYLHAMRDVQAHPPEERAGIALTRYSFTLDGPSFAAYMRDQMVAALQARGELPAGANLGASDYYQQMTGDGELWVGANGLPLRQLLNLNFPAQGDQSTHAQIVVDFARFGTPQLTPIAYVRSGDLSGLLATFPSALPALTPLALLFAFIGFACVVVYYRRSRLVYTGLVTALILSMVVGPVLSTLKLESFLAAQAAKAATQQEQQAAADATRAATVDFGQPAFNPQVNPIEAGNRRLETGGRRWETSPQSPVASRHLLTTDTGVDTDGDTLSDFTEERVGSDPAIADTDGDSLRDDVEVRGFARFNQIWYTDPRAIDSNNDGVSDGIEWGNDGNGQAADTDNDSVPDLFDTDNDNDGVPDREDLSPFSTGAATYNDASPLGLSLNNLTVGKPTFVDFQVRPTDPSRLWYAFNVLDWPNNDSAGQIQDVDGKTYADLSSSQGRSAVANESYGDMKLVPMLEIRLPTNGANLPPQSDLTPYNISVNNLTADGSQQVVYVPLTVVTAEQTGQRVAFSARMKYLPTGSWPTPHDVRLAWVVQTLVDVPCDATNPQDVANGCTDGYIPNVPQVIQSYYDDWTLTGLNVSEQHGAKTALIYEDPTADNNLRDDYPLSALTYGLDHSFLAGRDAAPNGLPNNQRDVDIDEIARRFDRDGNSGVSSDERWGLDGALNILQVERYNYATFDQATIFTAMTDTVQALTHFDTAWNTNNALKPTIAFAYEQQSRSVGLDATRTSGYITQNGANLAIDVQPAPINTMVGLKWTHYCRAAGASSWSPCASEVNWEELEQRYGNLPLSDDPPGADIAAGSNGLMQIYDLTLSGGVNAVVQTGNTPLPDAFPFDNDTQTADNLRRFSGAGGALFKKLANEVIARQYQSSTQLKREVGAIVNQIKRGEDARNIARQIKNLPTKSSSSTRLAVGGTVFIVALAVGVAALDQALANNRDGRLALHTILGSVQIIASGVLPLVTVGRLLYNGASVGSLLTSSSEVLGVSRTANLIGAVVSILIVWGFFTYTVLHEDISPNSIEFGAVLAQAIATTIYIIVLTILSATAVGLILVGLVTVIDAILTIICEFTGDSCFSIGGSVIKALADAFYTYGLFIDAERSDLVQPGAPITSLADPNKGFVAGNDLRITMPITTHIVQKKPNNNIIDDYSWMIGNSLRATTFRYSVSQPNPQDVPDAGRDTMSADWHNLHLVLQHPKYKLYGAYANSTPSPVGGFNLQPGLNRPAPFYLNMAYALPAYSCWRIYVPWYAYPFYKAIPFCGEKTIDGKNSSPITALRYDIFPNTLGGFLTVATKADGGRGLSWDSAFPSLQDADGDGLRASLFGGLDPDDSKTDLDNDGLADGFEVEARAAGTPYSPIACDSDNDGLSDGQEAEFNTNPANRDSDNDGLTDADELWHRVYNPSTCQPTNNWSGGWSVTINAAVPFALRVSADPTTDDTDGDGISDLAERQLAGQLDSQNRPYHPNVVNLPPLAVYTTANKRYVAPGGTLIYTTTVIANQPMAPGVLDVSAPTQLGSVQASYPLNFNPAATGSQTVTQQTALSAQAGLNTQVVSLTSNARTRLAPTGSATLSWDPIVLNALGLQSQAVGHYMSVASTGRNGQDNYLASSYNATSGAGSVTAHRLPDGQVSQLFATTATDTLTGNFSDMACNNNGVCLVAWEQHTTGSSGVRDWIYGQIVGANGQAQRSLEILGQTDMWAYHPTVASDGNDFLVVFEYSVEIVGHPMNPTGSTPMTRLFVARYNAAGDLITTTNHELELPRFAPRDQASVGMDLIWIGDRYRLAWKFIRPQGFPASLSIYAANLDSNGALQGVIDNVVGQDAARGSAATPALAYDPVNNRTLLTFQWANTEVHRVLFAGSSLTPVLFDGILGRNEGGAALVTGNRPLVAYNPMANGWLIGTSGGSQSRAMLWRPDLSDRLLADTVRTDAGSPLLHNGSTGGLACPAVIPQPLVDLRFEEVPGATTFSDSSGRGNNATCGNCPSAGSAGAVDSSGNAIGTPASDYALSFNGDFSQGLVIPTGVQNGFSVAFWYKSPPSTNPDSLWIDDGGQPFWSFNVFGQYVEFRTGATSFRANVNLNDNNWHLVVATRDDATGQGAIYLDGNPTPAATLANFSIPGQRSPLLLRSRRVASVDEFQIYPYALSGSQIQAIYNRTDLAYCAVAQPYSSVPNWYKLNVTQSDPRGGKLTASGSLSITIDADKPTSTVGGLVNNQFIRGNTVHTIGGNATDATSGIAQVEVNINNGGWQSATGAEAWAYNLVATTGNYTIQSRATDAVGNVETPGAGITVRADATLPNVTLNTLPATPSKPVRNANNLWVTTLAGTASDTESGVQTVQVLLQGQGAAVGNGWQTATRNGNTWSLDYTFPSALVDPTGVYTVSARAVDAVGNQTADSATTGILRLDVTGPAVALSTLDVERLLITDTVTISGLITDTGTAGIDKLEIAFVPVEKIAALPANATPAQADAQLARTWLPVTVAQRGAGVLQSGWSVQMPAALENEYQVDLRATDLLGNVLQTTELWRGVIDTLAPRVSITSNGAPVTWFDTNLGFQVYNLNFTCTAIDRYLNEATFTCPAGGATPVRTFDTDPILQALFPDRTIMTGLTVHATYPWDSPNPSLTIRACDIYGHCSLLNQTLTAATASAAGGTVQGASLQSPVASRQAAAAAPLAVVVAPTAGSYVAVDGDLPVTLAAEASAGLQAVTLKLDNTVVQTLSFAQSENVTRTLRTVSLSGVTEGQHTLVVHATDWANGTQSSDHSVTFTLDRQAPAVSIDPATLTNADTWAVGSGVLRFNGNASDAIGLAAVQIREGNGGFVDVTFGGGAWQTALPVTDPEGRTLNITVRAIDQAGRISMVTQTIGTNLSTAAAPDTTISSTPAHPSAVNTASFEFSGNVAAVAFECQLDSAAYTACASPWVLSDLSKGSHTFRVRAIDNTGAVDLTPAEFTWTVNASALDATITAGPTNPTNSRDASFTFTGTGTALDCALDDAAFAPCTSPQNYSGLTYGDHSFQVRAGNGGAVGAAARFTWAIVNAAPVANSQTVNTNENVAVAVNLTAIDNDALTYQVRAPAHGVLLGVAPNLTYSPDSDFSGTDSFTFVANDGQLTSNVATVTINVATNNTDTTPPVITPQVTGTADSNGWYVSDVSLTWNVVDGESPITSQTSCDPATVNTETAGQTFTCTATSRGGTATQSVTIKLDKTLPDTTITAQPANPSTVATAAFQFSGTDNLSSVAGFECSLDNSAFAACTTPQNYNGLAEGSHTFQVRTIDGAGNRDATPALYTWTVQSLTVVATCGPITVYRNAQGQLVAPGWVGTIKLGTAGNNTINGASGPDLILGLGGNDKLDGKAGDDLICGGDGVDLLTGGAGNDTLDGGAGNDVLNSGAGDFDDLSGGEGNDVLLDGDGVISALGGPGNDAFTLALRNGWRDRNGQTRFTGLAAGYGNDTVGLAILNTVRFFIDITGDERDEPASPLEGTTDGLVLAGLIDPASVIIKFERRVGLANGGVENGPSVDVTAFFVDPTTLTDESGTTFLTEPVGGDTAVEEVEQIAEARTQLYLPLITAAK